MDKKGFIKTIEAIVAVLLLYIFITAILIQNKPKQASVPLDVKLTQESVLKEVSNSNYYRNCVLRNDKNCVDSLMRKTIGDQYNYTFSLCTATQCSLPITPAKDVYYNSIIIASNFTDYQTTSVNLYIWKNI